jgi:hypothetical protein
MRYAGHIESFETALDRLLNDPGEAEADGAVLIATCNAASTSRISSSSRIVISLTRARRSSTGKANNGHLLKTLFS